MFPSFHKNNSLALSFIQLDSLKRSEKGFFAQIALQLLCFFSKMLYFCRYYLNVHFDIFFVLPCFNGALAGQENDSSIFKEFNMKCSFQEAKRGIIIILTKKKTFANDLLRDNKSPRRNET